MFERRSLKGSLATHTNERANSKPGQAEWTGSSSQLSVFIANPELSRAVIKTWWLTSCDDEVPLSHLPYSRCDTMYTPQQHTGGMC
jgi:hypothetical protein